MFEKPFFHFVVDLVTHKSMPDSIKFIRDHTLFLSANNIEELVWSILNQILAFVRMRGRILAPIEHSNPVATFFSFFDWVLNFVRFMNIKISMT